jgi:hypothetical protein
MCFRTVGLATGIFLFSATFFGAENAKPNFSGTWILDKEKSDMRTPQGGGGGHRSGGPGMGVPGMGGPRMGGGGWPGGGGMGGPRMGGPGMGGPRMGGPGMGGPDWGGGTSPGGSGRRGPSQEEMGDNRPRFGIPEKLSIEHAEPSLTIKRTLKLDGEDQEQESKYTTDGKANKNEMPGGRVVKSKTKWEGLQLVTKSDVETPMGKMGIVETRTLSGDGKVMTVALETKGEYGEWTQHLIYNKETDSSKPETANP